MRQLHDYCKLFPPCTAEEYVLLKESIKKNGLLEPLVLLDGKILDGQNRDMVCQELGIEPDTVEFTGDDPLEFVLSKNLHRRHLNESQRAMIASELANMCRGEPKPANLPVYESQQPQGITQNRRVSQAEAAEMLNVSERSVRTAAKIKKDATPEVIQQVKEGKKTLNAAMTERKPKEKQQSNPRNKTIAKTEVPEHGQYIIMNLGTPEPITVHFPLPENDRENKHYPLTDYIAILFGLDDDDLHADDDRYDNRLIEMRNIGKALTTLANTIIDLAD